MPNYTTRDKKKLDKYFSTSNFDSGVELENKLALASGRKAKPKEDVQMDRMKAFTGVNDSAEQARVKEASELADQYKRETRGKKDTQPRGKIKMRKPEGYAGGGKVRGCGAATKGLTKGKMR